MKKLIVISLGGSVIVPDNINYLFLDRFKKTLKKFYKTHKFVIVCGGGVIARKYIEALRKEGKSKMEQSLAGIRATRTNALFMIQFFGKEANDTLPLNMKEVMSNIHKNSVVFCGSLRFIEDSTSDETAAKLAGLLKTDFINITNVDGLYTTDPNKNKDSKFIPTISFKEFEEKAHKIKHRAGQHFVLDQKSSSLIRGHKIKTYIINSDLSNFTNLLKQKKFKGTTIYG